MTDQMYAYLCKVESIANDVGMFDIKSVSSAEEIDLLNQAKAAGWLHIRSGDHFITRSGFAALQAAKNVREQRTRQEEKDTADKAQAVKDRKQERRHDFAVASFTVALTLCVEHFQAIVDFLKALFK